MTPTFFRRLMREESAATAVEYAFILAVIVIGIFTSVQLFGNSGNGVMGNNNTTISNAVNGATGS